jgi:hypothetical protein
MTVKRINSVLRTTVVACCAVAAIAVVAAVLIPLDLGGAGESGGVATGADHRPTTMPSSEAGDAFLARALRGPMSDNVAANPTGARQTTVAGPQSMALVGTIGDALALIRMPDGSVVARGVGDEVGDGSVVAIGAKGVEVLVNGQHVLLSKPQPATSTGVLVERAS